MAAARTVGTTVLASSLSASFHSPAVFGQLKGAFVKVGLGSIGGGGGLQSGGWPGLGGIGGGGGLQPGGWLDLGGIGGGGGLQSGGWPGLWGLGTVRCDGAGLVITEVLGA